MQVTATEAKNRFGQMLDAAQAGPVIIEKSGRRHSGLLMKMRIFAMRLIRARRFMRSTKSGWIGRTN
jgi:hypothetical protein